MGHMSEGSSLKDCRKESLAQRGQPGVSPSIPIAIWARYRPMATRVHPLAPVSLARRPRRVVAIPSRVSSTLPGCGGRFPSDWLVGLVSPTNFDRRIQAISQFTMNWTHRPGCPLDGPGGAVPLGEVVQEGEDEPQGLRGEHGHGVIWAPGIRPFVLADDGIYTVIFIYKRSV